MLKHRSLRIAFRVAAILLVAACCASLLAQEVQQIPPSEKADSPKPRPVSRKPYAFSAGETLTYEVRFSRFPIYARVGDLTLTVEDPEPETEMSAPMIKFKGEAVSRGLLVSLFGIKVHDTFESYADAGDLGVSATIKRTLEGRRQREQSTSILREEQQLWFTDTDLAAPDRKTSITKEKTENWVSDMMSIIYFARTIDLPLSETIEIPLCDNTRTYSVPVTIFAKETVKTDLDTFKTIRVQPDIFFGKLFSKGGSMDVWLTDDAYRIPVKFNMKTSYGTVSGELTMKHLMPLPPELKPQVAKTFSPRAAIWTCVSGDSPFGKH